MPWHLKPIKRQDLLPITEIFRSIMPIPWSAKLIEEEWEISQSFSRAAVENDRIIGFIFLRPIDNGLELTAIGVLKGYQRKKVGQYLVKQALEAAIGCAEVILEVSHKNIQAIEFYKSQGFEIFNVRRQYYRDGSDALCMKLKLAKP